MIVEYALLANKLIDYLLCDFYSDIDFAIRELTKIAALRILVQVYKITGRTKGF